MGDERRNDAAPERVRADAYSSARIGAAAAFTLVLVVLPVLDVVPPGATSARAPSCRSCDPRDQAPHDRGRGGVGREHERVGVRADRVLGRGSGVLDRRPQFEAVARLVATAHRATGLRINRSTECRLAADLVGQTHAEASIGPAPRCRTAQEEAPP
jgi:hypothetical protein